MSSAPTTAAPISEWSGEERVIRARHGLAALDFRELWHYRELLGILVWRNIAIRYKQTYLGIAWAVLQPVLTVAVLTYVFGRLTGVDVDIKGLPANCYSLVILAALLPGNFLRTLSAKAARRC